MEEGSEDFEREEEDAETELLRDRFRLSTISIAESQAKTFNMEISQPIISCISDLAFKYGEQLAKDLELFAQHAGRKSVNVEDVILAVLIPHDSYPTTLNRTFHNYTELVQSNLMLYGEDRVSHFETEIWEKIAKIPSLFTSLDRGSSILGYLMSLNLAAHRNEHLAVSLRTFYNDLKSKEPQSEKKCKNAKRKKDKATTSILPIADL
ncbi:CENP-S/Mhf1 [Dillenia turbinata]|uniref:CENP-S/Mhf1 n=1 Tax=Dillenia turbinata TaxID=194707 RepID=A0AAN8Z4L5_9MAGN